MGKYNDDDIKWNETEEKRKREKIEEKMTHNTHTNKLLNLLSVSVIKPNKTLFISLLEMGDEIK